MHAQIIIISIARHASCKAEEIECYSVAMLNLFAYEFLKNMIINVRNLQPMLPLVMVL